MMLYKICDFVGCNEFDVMFGQLFLAEATNEAASVTRTACLQRTSVLTARFTVAPIPSTAPLPWFVAKKCHCTLKAGNSSLNVVDMKHQMNLFLN